MLEFENSKICIGDTILHSYAHFKVNLNDLHYSAWRIIVPRNHEPSIKILIKLIHRDTPVQHFIRNSPIAGQPQHDPQNEWVNKKATKLWHGSIILCGVEPSVCSIKAAENICDFRKKLLNRKIMFHHLIQIGRKAWVIIVCRKLFWRFKWTRRIRFLHKLLHLQ